MLEEIINSLDSRGLRILTVLVGKRTMELLKEEDNNQGTKVNTILSTNGPLLVPENAQAIRSN